VCSQQYNDEALLVFAVITFSRQGGLYVTGLFGKFSAICLFQGKMNHKF